MGNKAWNVNRTFMGEKNSMKERDKKNKCEKEKIIINGKNQLFPK